MTRDEIMSMARSAGIEGEFMLNNTDELRKFAQLAADAVHIKNCDAVEMAECLDMLRSDLISAGVVGPEVAPMFLTEAVLSAVGRERAARQDAQQRLADLQERLVRADAERCAAVIAAVAAELEACEERVVTLYEGLETPYLPDITRAIRARGEA